MPGDDRVGRVRSSRRRSVPRLTPILGCRSVEAAGAGSSCRTAVDAARAAGCRVRLRPVGPPQCGIRRVDLGHGRPGRGARARSRCRRRCPGPSRRWPAWPARTSRRACPARLAPSISPGCRAGGCRRRTRRSRWPRRCRRSGRPGRCTRRRPGRTRSWRCTGPTGVNVITPGWIVATRRGGPTRGGAGRRARGPRRRPARRRDERRDHDARRRTDSDLHCTLTSPCARRR